MAKLITSLQNPLIKNVLLLEEKPRERKNQNLIVIEGVREIRLALSSGFTVTTLFFCRDYINDRDFDQFASHSLSSFELIEVPGEI